MIILSTLLVCYNTPSFIAIGNLIMSSFEIEIKILNSNNIPSLFYKSPHALIAGCDEVGRGCLAGPVVACCLCFKVDTPEDLLSHIKDSKKLSSKKREIISEQIKLYSHYKIAEVSVEIIDEINILQASLLAMKNAYEELSKEISPKFLIIDGNKSFKTDIPSFAIVKGDEKSLSIAGASILAKVYRDQLMKDLSVDYQDYDWENNAGYGTKKHLVGLANNGITIHHRKSFNPVKNSFINNTKTH